MDKVALSINVGAKKSRVAEGGGCDKKKEWQPTQETNTVLEVETQRKCFPIIILQNIWVEY